MIPTMKPTGDLPPMILFEDCKKGETSAKTGCTPASGGGGKKESTGKEENTEVEEIPGWASDPASSEIDYKLHDIGKKLGLELSTWSVSNKPGGGSIGKEHKIPFPSTSAKYIRKALGKDLTPEKAKEYQDRVLDIVAQPGVKNYEKEDYLADMNWVSDRMPSDGRIDPAKTKPSRDVDAAKEQMRGYFDRQKGGNSDYGELKALELLAEIMGK